MDKKYSAAVSRVLLKDQESTLSFIRDLRQKDGASAADLVQQKLLSFRLALKNGTGFALDENDLSSAGIADVFLRAEIHFVRGMVLVHKNKSLEAAHEMALASTLYLNCAHHEKYCLSHYNEIIFRGNTEEALTANEELAQLSLLAARSESFGVHKVVGLCHRQRSYIYFQNKRILAAGEEIEMALRHIEAHCPTSDYHLALIHAADCAIENKDHRKAELMLNYISESVDSRVEFPLAYIRAKLSRQILVIEKFNDIQNHWRCRYEEFQTSLLENQEGAAVARTFRWNLQTHLVVDEKRKLLGKIKFASLEGQLLQMLGKGPVSKDLVCEVLWPDYSQVETLDDRFFRLKNRLTQKLGEIIDFDGTNYKLRGDLKILK
jgi:hypothetical protein